MKAPRAVNNAVKEIAGDLVLPRCLLGRTLFMVVGGDERSLKDGSEGAVDDDCRVGEVDRCRCVGS